MFEFKEGMVVILGLMNVLNINKELLESEVFENHIFSLFLSEEKPFIFQIMTFLVKYIF